MTSKIVRVWSGRRTCCLALCLVLLALCVGALAQQAAPASAPLSKVLPGDTAFVVTGDAGWWWGNFATVRAMPTVKTGLAGAEALLGMSLDKDLLPCIGQVGFGFLDLKDMSPNMLLVLEIRDQAAFAKVLPSLQSHIEMLTGQKWTATSYAGVSLRYANFGEGAPSVAWGQYGGWLVIGVGQGTVRRGIDAWKGTAPALADNAAWMKSLAQLPAKPLVFFGMNGTAYAKFMKTLMATMPTMPGVTPTTFPTALYDGLIAAGTLTESEKGLRIEAVGSVGPALLPQYQALKHGLIPIDGKALAQLPAGTFAALLLANPGKWVAMEQGMLQTTLDAGMMKQLADMLQISPELQKQLTPALALLGNLSGQFGLAGTWTLDGGFGLVAVGETPTAEKASALTGLVTDLLKKVVPQYPVQVKDGVASLPVIPLADTLNLNACWTAQDVWFKCASDPRWLGGAAQPILQLPAEAAGADTVFLADLGFLTPLLAQEEVRNGKSAWVDALRGMKLDKIQIAGYSTISDDGASMHEVANVNNLLGKDIVDDLSLVLGLLPKNATDADTAAFKEQQTASLSNLRRLAIAVLEFAQDNGEVLPALKTADDIKTVLKADDKILRQPSSKQPYQPNASIAGQPLAKYAGKEAETLLFYDPAPYPDGSRCVAYLDGHVEVLSAKDWKALKGD